MSDGSTIEWLKRLGTKPATWNPVRGCTRVSRGCGAADGGGCYAEVLAARFSLSAEDLQAAWLANPPKNATAMPAFKDQWGHGFAETIKKPDGTSVRRWTGKVELIEEKLLEPLRWKDPRTIFANSTSDLFHEKLPDEAIHRCFAVMAACPQHDFLILTKRPERMRNILSRVEFAADVRTELNSMADVGTISQAQCVSACVAMSAGPLPNVWLGVSTEDQPRADYRIPLLLETPAVIRFVSAEPLLGPIDFTRLRLKAGGHAFLDALRGRFDIAGYAHDLPSPLPAPVTPLDQIIVGGESGPNARRHDLEWDLDILVQCRAAGGTAFFEKQAGSNAHLNGTLLRLRDSKGGDMSEWPADLRVREFPEARAA